MTDPENENDFFTVSGDEASAEQHSYAHRLIELDLEELLGKSRPPDLVATTVGRAQADAGYQQFRRAQHGVAPGFIAFGFFLLAGVVLLAMPWLMHPPMPQLPSPPPVPTAPAGTRALDTAASPPASVAPTAIERQAVKYDPRLLLGSLVVKASRVTCEDRVVYGESSNDSLVATVELLAEYLLGKKESMPEPGAPPTSMTVEGVAEGRTVSMQLKDGRMLGVSYTEGALIIREGENGDPVLFPLPTTDSPDREAQDQALGDRLLTMVRPAPLPLPAVPTHMDPTLKTAPTVEVVKHHSDIEMLPDDTIAVRGIRLGDFELAALAGASNRLTRLVSIDLDGCTRITDFGLGNLEAYGQLETLNLARTGTADAGLRGLWRLSRLKRLYLTDCKITNEGVRILESFTDLETLSLAGTEITEVGLRSLRGLPRLRILDVRNLKLEAAGLGALGDLVQLHTLYLGGVLYQAEDLKALAGLSQLDSLVLWQPASSQSLAFLDQFPKLATLAFEAKESTGDAAECLVQFRGLVSLPRSLRHFRLLRIEPPLDVLTALADKYYLKSLELVGADLSNPQLLILGNRFASQALELLDLSLPQEADDPSEPLDFLSKRKRRIPALDAIVRTEGLRALEYLTSLRVLDLTGRGFPESSIDRLKLALPGCTIRQ